MAFFAETLPREMLAVPLSHLLARPAESAPREYVAEGKADHVSRLHARSSSAMYGGSPPDEAAGGTRGTLTRGAVDAHLEQRCTATLDSRKSTDSKEAVDFVRGLHGAIHRQLTDERPDLLTGADELTFQGWLEAGTAEYLAVKKLVENGEDKALPDVNEFAKSAIDDHYQRIETHLRDRQRVLSPALARFEAAVGLAKTAGFFPELHDEYAAAQAEAKTFSATQARRFAIDMTLAMTAVTAAFLAAILGITALRKHIQDEPFRKQQCAASAHAAN